MIRMITSRHVFQSALPSSAMAMARAFANASADKTNLIDFL
jgi:hypothetical protein